MFDLLRKLLKPGPKPGSAVPVPATPMGPALTGHRTTHPPTDRPLAGYCHIRVARPVTAPSPGAAGVYQADRCPGLPTRWVHFTNGEPSIEMCLSHAAEETGQQTPPVDEHAQKRRDLARRYVGYTREALPAGHSGQEQPLLACLDDDPFDTITWAELQNLLRTWLIEDGHRWEPSAAWAKQGAYIATIMETLAAIGAAICDEHGPMTAAPAGVRPRWFCDTAVDCKRGFWAPDGIHYRRAGTWS